MNRMGIAAGMVYGCVLVAMTFFAAGFGHGLYFPLGVVSAPLSLVGVRTALLGIPFFWGLVGFYAVKRWQSWRLYTALLLAANYCGAAAALKGNPDGFADYSRWVEVPRGIRELSGAALGVYFLGQLVIWWQLARSHR